MNEKRGIYWVLNYMFMFNPSEADSIHQRHKNRSGELKSINPGAILIIETIIRIGFIMSIAYSIERLIGKELYEFSNMDILALIFVASGLLNIGTYYIIKKLAFLKYKIRDKLYSHLNLITSSTAAAIFPTFVICALEYFEITKIESDKNLFFISAAAVIAIIRLTYRYINLKNWNESEV